MKIRPDDLVPELSRKLDSLDILEQIADVAGETTVLRMRPTTAQKPPLPRLPR
jgi:hypothetical protein